MQDEVRLCFQSLSYDKWKSYTFSLGKMCSWKGWVHDRVLAALLCLAHASGRGVIGCFACHSKGGVSFIVVMRSIRLLWFFALEYHDGAFFLIRRKA